MGSAGDRLLPFGNFEVLWFRTVYWELVRLEHHTAQVGAAWWASSIAHSFLPTVPAMSEGTSRGYLGPLLWANLLCPLVPLASQVSVVRLRDGCFLDCLSVCAPLPCPEDTQVYICPGAAATVLLALCPVRWPVVTT